MGTQSLNMADSDAYKSSQKLDSTTKTATNLSVGDDIVNSYVINPHLPTVKPYNNPYEVPAVGGAKSEYEVVYKNLKIKVSAKSLDEASKKCFNDISKKLFRGKEIKKKVLTVLIRKFNVKRENKFYKFQITVRKIKSPNQKFQLDIKKINT
jgi:hypothetical protein